MMELRADLHTHTSDDPLDRIGHSAEMLIDTVAQFNIGVLAIACHERVVYTQTLAEYALRRGVLLVPAAELIVEGKHVVILNPDEEQARAATFADLRRLGKRDAAIFAPHPYFMLGSCLGEDLVANIDLFDAVEHCCLYARGVNLNRKAVRVAQRFGLPMIGTSDTHKLPYDDSTITRIEVEDPSVGAVIRAIRAGRVRVETCARPLALAVRMAAFAAAETLRRAMGSVG